MIIFDLSVAFAIFVILLFIFMEKNDPYSVRVIKLDEGFVHKGIEEVKAGLKHVVALETAAVHFSSPSRASIVNRPGTGVFAVTIRYVR